MPETASFRLAFHIEAPYGTDESLKHQLARLDGLQNLETRALQPARSIDPQSIVTTLFIITATAKAGVVTAHQIEELIASLKRIAKETGITRIHVETGYRKQDINQLKPEDIEELAKEKTIHPAVDGP